MHHAETYFKLISSYDASKLRLTKYVRIPSISPGNAQIKKIFLIHSLGKHVHFIFFDKITHIAAGIPLLLRRIDDEIYEDFELTFPEINVARLNEDHFKSSDAKEKWRPWINKYEKRVNDFNFGTLLRIDPTEDYTKENTMFGEFFLFCFFFWYHQFFCLWFSCALTMLGREAVGMCNV